MNPAVIATNLQPPAQYDHTYQFNNNCTDLSVHLEQVVVHLIQAVNTRSRCELQRIVQEHHAPSLILHRSQLSGVGTVAASDLEAYVDGILSYTTTNNFHMEPHNVTALVDEWKGTAKVFATVTASGTEEAGDAVTNESVLIYYLERFTSGSGGESKWMVVRLEYLRGPGNHFM